MSRTVVKFSIIVPTYDRPHQLTACLRALRNLDYPREDFELIVVDDSSPPTSFYCNLFDFLFDRQRGAAALRMAGLPLWSQLATLPGFAWEWLAHGERVS